jgi:type II secretory pathway pseudopilin PulG
MTLLELTIALSVFVVGMLGFLQSVLYAMALQRAQRDDAAVTEMARQTMASMQGTPFSQVYSRFNSSTLDDPFGVASPGSNVAVTGLRPLPTDADGFVGRITFPTRDVGGGVPELRENLTFPQFGTPRDLSGDGATDTADHSTNYVILPVMISFDWLSAKGPRHLEFRTILAGY